jgi:hypothetical protein
VQPLILVTNIGAPPAQRLACMALANLAANDDLQLQIVQARVCKRHVRVGSTAVEPCGLRTDFARWHTAVMLAVPCLSRK